MRVVLGLQLVLLGLCGSGAQGEGGGLSEVVELSEFQKTDPRDAVEEASEQTTEQTYTDIWAEVRALRDMVVELKVELKNMESRVKDSESQVNELKAELIVTKVHVELLQRENSVIHCRCFNSRLAGQSRIDELERETTAQATALMSLKSRLTATESKTSDLQKQNADLQARLSSTESELLIIKSRIDELERETTE
ncbi:hypothetical protein D5F01_LYC13417 [Larimichthys crocea]|uniref:Uncharacterized protein n=1 Tax=Larimichthys crocea TaxID=215358 RepID=A0A6G0I765_LARCR|nr:hypothetical protein D5F01_LYC13417 [Larimichthys crocea]